MPASGAGRGGPRAAVSLLLFLAGASALAQGAAGSGAAGPEACVACHGPGGNSRVPTVPSIAAQPATFLENQLVLIREGLRDVPSMKAVMGGLSDEQIVAIARHFSAQPAQSVRGAADAARLRAGAEISRRALCGTCHLPGYTGQSQVPRLAGQQEAYLVATMKMYRDNPEPGRDTAMSGVLKGLADADLQALAHHFAHSGP